MLYDNNSKISSNSSKDKVNSPSKSLSSNNSNKKNNDSSKSVSIQKNILNSMTNQFLNKINFSLINSNTVKAPLEIINEYTYNKEHLKEQFPDIRRKQSNDKETIQNESQNNLRQSNNYQVGLKINESNNNNFNSIEISKDTPYFEMSKNHSTKLIKAGISSKSSPKISEKIKNLEFAKSVLHLKFDNKIIYKNKNDSETIDLNNYSQCVSNNNGNPNFTSNESVFKSSSLFRNKLQSSREKKINIFERLKEINIFSLISEQIIKQTMESN